MDVHGGKTIIDGPKNYLGASYRSVPVAITVEGANTLTRSLMVFGQGAIRAHPYMLKEILALGDANKARGLDQFDEVFWKHVGHALRTMLRAAGRSWTAAAFAPSPDAGAARKYYRRLGRYSAAFALTSDMALLTLGGALKRRELLSARLGDILSEMYFLSAACKRWEDEGRQEADLGVLDYVMVAGSARIEASFDEVFANLPNQLVGALLRFAILPLGPRVRGPSDASIRACADILLEPNATRDRLVEGCYIGGETAIGKLLHAFQLTVETQPIHDRLRKSKIKAWKVGLEQGLVSEEEARRLEEADKAVAEVIDVDDFSPEELTQHRAVEEAPTRTSPEEAGAQTRGSNPEPSASKKGVGAAPARQPEPAE